MPVVMRKAQNQQHQCVPDLTSNTDISPLMISEDSTLRRHHNLLLRGMSSLSARSNSSCCSCYGNNMKNSSSVYPNNSVKPSLSKRCMSRVWEVHFSFAILVLFFGIINNHESRKYVIISPKKVRNAQCHKAFLNVMASSENDTDAIICCNERKNVDEYLSLANQPDPPPPGSSSSAAASRHLDATMGDSPEKLAKEHASLMGADLTTCLCLSSSKELCVCASPNSQIYHIRATLYSHSCYILPNENHDDDYLDYSQTNHHIYYQPSYYQNLSEPEFTFLNQSNNLNTTMRRHRPQETKSPLLPKLPFATRLARFPDAWLLPIFPLFLRLIYWVYRITKSLIGFGTFLLVGCSSPKNSSRSTTENMTKQDPLNDQPADDNSVASNSIAALTSFSKSSLIFFIRRLVLYFLIMAFRGWILYLGLNRIEEYLVEMLNGNSNHSADGEHHYPLDTLSSRITSFVGFSSHSHSFDDANANSSFADMMPSSTPNTCWYQDYLREKEPCHGRDFDFSDHLVLYYAQILPIAMIETLYSFQYPYWGKTSMRTPRISHRIWPITLAACQIYLHFITAVGAYKTTAFFHTGPEVFAGFLVSLLIAVPLCQLQCSSRKWAKTSRTFFFGE